jgi:ribonuclease T
MSSQKLVVGNRFRGFLPVVVDVETAGFDAQHDALLEIAAIEITYNDAGLLTPHATHHFHIQPFEGANLDPAALKFLNMDPYHPFRLAVDEKIALTSLFDALHKTIARERCQRAILVGHNAFFDLGFVQAASQRCHLQDNPFHRFSTLDTASLGALVYGQTVLAKALHAANLPFDNTQAHGALYDAQCTAALFCQIVNEWDGRETR